MRVMVLTVLAVSLGGAGQDYRKYKGQVKTFCGPVVEVTAAFRKCEPALLIGGWADNWKVAAVIPASVRSNLPQEPDHYLFSEICVTGTVVEEKKKPYVLVEQVSQLQLVKPAERIFAPHAVRSCTEGLELPKPVREVRPVYTRRAMQEKARGLVLVQAVVGADGVVGESRVVRTLHPDLDAAALESLGKWRFEPGRLHGVAVPTLVDLEFTFTLR